MNDAAREKLATMLAGRMCRACKAYREHQEMADAILAAFPQIAAPAQTTKEESREQVMALVTRIIRSDPTFPLFDEIMAVVAAAEARVREWAARECERIADGGTVPAGAYSCAEHACAAAIRAGGGR